VNGGQDRQDGGKGGEGLLITTELTTKSHRSSKVNIRFKSLLKKFILSQISFLFSIFRNPKSMKMS
jgi:hypothetical protein